MPVDVFIKRFFPLTVLGLIALAAYFQASGLVQLAVAGMMTGEEEATVDGAWAQAARTGAAPSGPAKKSAEPILSRNPFDSVTGPLNAKLLEIGEVAGAAGGDDAAPLALDLSDPLGASDCSGVAVHIVTESPDPSWSVAVLQAQGEESQLRRVGDEVGEQQVAYIGFNPRRNSPAVWLVSDASLCQALLFGASKDTGAAKPAAKTPAKPVPPSAKRATGPASVPKDIADKIQKVSDSEFNVDRSVVDSILENQAELMKTARIVPEQQDGKVVGIRMFGIRPDTLLGQLGLQNGDRLEAINGFDMTSPEKALEAYARLRTAEGLAVKITRRGKPMTIDFKIQ